MAVSPLHIGTGTNPNNMSQLFSNMDINSIDIESFYNNEKVKIKGELFSKGVYIKLIDKTSNGTKKHLVYRWGNATKFARDLNLLYQSCGKGSITEKILENRKEKYELFGKKTGVKKIEIEKPKISELHKTRFYIKSKFEILISCQ